MSKPLKDHSFMEKLATFIVDKRSLFFLLYIFAIIFSLFSMSWVKVENDVTKYLPEDTETRQGIEAMNENFISFATARVMVSNITYDTAQDSYGQLQDVEGVGICKLTDQDVVRHVMVQRIIKAYDDYYTAANKAKKK